MAPGQKLNYVHKIKMETGIETSAGTTPFTLGTKTLNDLPNNKPGSQSEESQIQDLVQKEIDDDENSEQDASHENSQTQHQQPGSESASNSRSRSESGVSRLDQNNKLKTDGNGAIGVGYRLFYVVCSYCWLGLT